MYILLNLDVLRKLCHDGLPTNNYFDLCSVYLLEFENMMKDNEIKNKPLKQLVFETQEKQTTLNTGKPRKSPSINKPIENSLSKIAPINIIPKTKVNLKSKEFSVVNFNIEIDNNRAINNHRELFSENFELKSVKFNHHKIERKNLEILSIEKKETKEMQNFIEQKDNELKILPSTLPEDVSFTNIPLESFEINVDIVNHLSVSGNLEDFKYTIKNKNDQDNSINLNRDELNIIDQVELNEYKNNSQNELPLNDNFISSRQNEEETVQKEQEVTKNEKKEEEEIKDLQENQHEQLEVKNEEENININNTNQEEDPVNTQEKLFSERKTNDEKDEDLNNIENNTLKQDNIEGDKVNYEN
jgi:hypothetical protein